MNQEMPTFDVSSIPQEFNPLKNTLGDGPNAVSNDGDEKLYVQFNTQAVLNPSKSTQAGRPIYDDIDMITVRTPGSQLTSIVDHAKRYTQGRPVLAEKYKNWKSGQLESAGGTPLDNFPFLFTKPSLIAELKYRNIFTVEQLADLSDTGKQSIMGGHELCKLAGEWIKKTAGEADDAEKAEMKNELAELKAQMAALTADKPTRKRKIDEVPAFLQEG